MERFLGLDIEDVNERKSYLRDNADAIEDLGYTKNLPTHELEALKDQLVESNIKLRDVRSDKKEANKGFNDQIKTLEEEVDEITAKLKSRTVFVNEQCFKFIEGNEVGYYNSEGILVFSRPARPEERQRTMFSEFRRTGTD